MNPFFMLSAIMFTIAGQDHGNHAHGPQLGTVSFQTSCNAAANARFVEGLGWLHSFEYERAEANFTQAATADPRCGIAYWGVAMSNYHPLWAQPTAEELEKGRGAVAKAGSADASSPRERDYLNAISAFYRGSESVDHKTRVLAYNAAMADLHRRYPDDNEAAVFYALSLIAAGTMDSDPRFTKEKEAGAILNRVLTLNPEHPGVAHYLIHSFDYPPLAQLALPAAKRYASIAPASAHAQHMPSHIFTRLGLWEDAIQSDLKAESAARAYASANGMPGSWDERLHAMDYLAYAYLQTGQDAKAQGVWNDLKSIQRVDPPNLKVAYTATAVPARILLERREWQKAADLELPENVRGLVPMKNFQWAEAHVHFARAVGAARSGDPTRARAEVAQLSAIERAMVIPAGTYDWKTQVSINRQIAAAWLARAEGRTDEAVRLMTAAADLDDATEKHPVTPGAILPAREQLGELLLEAGRPQAALTAFKASLNRAPKRLAGLIGAARAATLAGHEAEAARHYSELVDVTKSSDGTRAEVREARRRAGPTASR